MAEEVRAIIFDMDGSLVDSMWIWPEVDRIYMEKYGLTEPEHFHKDIEGMSLTQTAVYFQEKFSLPFTIEEIQGEWEEMTLSLYRDQVFLKPGAREFLDRLNRKGLSLGIATSNAGRLARANLNALGILPFFSAICTADEVVKGKPAPDIYLKTSEVLNIPPDQCLVFEDLVNGILAGKQAGMKVCAVSDPFSAPDEEQKKQLADYYIQDFRDMLNGTYEVCCHREGEIK